jgi:hypothetical protein
MQLNEEISKTSQALVVNQLPADKYTSVVDLPPLSGDIGGGLVVIVQKGQNMAAASHHQFCTMPVMSIQCRQMECRVSMPVTGLYVRPLQLTICQSTRVQLRKNETFIKESQVKPFRPI